MREAWGCSTKVTKGARAQLTFVLVSLGLAIFFVAVPAVDLQFTDPFYESPRGFYLDGTWWVQIMYRGVPPLAGGIAVALLALLIHNLVRRRAVRPFDTRTILYLLAALALGPGLVVNAVFKDHWGRARPRDVVQFGGTMEFTPAFVVSDQCERNCSFVAGHPSVPFYLMAFALIARRRRYALFTGSILIGSVVGFGRIVQGAHFLSDVVFSGVFTFLVAYILWRFVFRLRENAA